MNDASEIIILANTRANTFVARVDCTKETVLCAGLQVKSMAESFPCLIYYINGEPKVQNNIESISSDDVVDFLLEHAKKAEVIAIKDTMQVLISFYVYFYKSWSKLLHFGEGKVLF